jgi:hypothetical protein
MASIISCNNTSFDIGYLNEQLAISN